MISRYYFLFLLAGISIGVQAQEQAMMIEIAGPENFKKRPKAKGPLFISFESTDGAGIMVEFQDKEDKTKVEFPWQLTQDYIKQHSNDLFLDKMKPAAIKDRNGFESDHFTEQSKTSLFHSKDWPVKVKFSDLFNGDYSIPTPGIEVNYSKGLASPAVVVKLPFLGKKIPGVKAPTFIAYVYNNKPGIKVSFGRIEVIAQSLSSSELKFNIDNEFTGKIDAFAGHVTMNKDPKAYKKLVEKLTADTIDIEFMKKNV